MGGWKGRTSWNGSSLLQQAGMNRLEGLETTSLIQPGSSLFRTSWNTSWKRL
jgi:hypothetical protein